MSKYVLDTNVLISNPYSIYSFTQPGTEIIITSATMGELDHLKTKERTAHEARLAIRLLSKVIFGQSYDAITKSGIPLNLTNPALSDTITLKVVDYVGNKTFALDKQDERIIETCMQQDATLVTRDIMMLLIAMSRGCKVEQYTGDDTLKDSDVLYSGYVEIPDFWDTVEVLGYTDNVAQITYSSLPDEDFYPNQYITSNGELVGRVVTADEICLNVLPVKHEQAMKRKLMKAIQPRDSLQAAFVESIMSNEIDVATIMGGAGSGKTMLAVSGAMHLVNSGHYANLMYVKSDSPLSSEIGFLPGTLGEKGNIVFNAYTQYDFWTPGPRVDYDAIGNAFKQAVGLADAVKTGKPIITPLIGAGLAGGDWELIKRIINEVTGDYPIIVVHFDPRKVN
ncbi:hypothetical protein PMMJPKLI_00094 [Klebsiella phage KP13MC5-1]|nr:hypothetical protein PMMJPKLI_00094 [Klebsiella phage KP13MC5-1]